MISGTCARLLRMETTTLDLQPQAAEVARVVAAVRDDQLTAATPCTGTSVAGLLDHFVGLTLAFRLGAEKQPQQGAPRADAAQLPADWRDRLPSQLDALVVAWREPAAWEGVTEVGGAQLPAAAMGVVAANEVLVHGWDVAVATGQPYRADPVTAERCLAFVAGVPAEMRSSMFGPIVPVGEHAPVFDRLLGLTGRDPGWAAGATETG
jgi:uncharacterized protein (TIGR03086 family)